LTTDEDRSAEQPEGVRLQKVLAAAGVASRRVSEQLIVAGRVQVNGKVVTELGNRIDPATDLVAVDGVAVQLDPAKRYYMLNKPRGVVSSMRDEQGRPDLRRFTDGLEERVFNVGRLDAETSGLLLLTNDGELGHRLMHPSYEVPKTYLAEIEGKIARDLGRRLRDGIELEDGIARVDAFKLVDAVPGRATVQLVLHEGRKHIVRRMLSEVGHPVLRLVRTHVGSVALGNQRPGKLRPLDRVEVGSLYKAVGL
jgi:23S rRNA pseudouridine2605 synthase